MTTLKVNGREVTIDAPPETPLLWVLRDDLGLTGTKFGCGIAQCGACTVHVDAAATRSCSIRLQDVAGADIVTIEGLAPGGDHALVRAWVAEQVPQCGYCQSGQIMSAAALLAKTPDPDEGDIRAGMDGNICRCGTYPRIVRAIQRAVQEG